MMRDDGEDMRVFAALGDIVYSISRKELIEQGFLSDAIVEYHKCGFDLSQDRYLNYSEIYKKHVVENNNRNELIIEQIRQNVINSKKILVLVSQVEHGNNLFNWLQNMNLNKNGIWLNGKSKKEEREQDLSKFDVIIATQIFDEGVDLPSLDVVILAAGGKSSIKLTQRVGRVLRPLPGKKALIVDFIDTPKYLVDHYHKRRKLLEEDFEVIDK